jgi:methylenetetrahydrofolate dehydrogenase (NADP+)/methenyltetrahydrofolate cyclohydrolase
MMLVEEGRATVTVCHKYTKDIGSFTRQADILIVAVGKPGLLLRIW